MPTRAASKPSVSPVKRQAWQRFLRAQSFLLRALDEELQASHGIALSEYDVLVQLSRAGAAGVSMGKLADWVALTRSGVSRIVERLERRGLVTRSRSTEGDARVICPRITDHGRELLAAAGPTHLAGIQRGFWAHVTAEDATVLAEVFARVLAAVGAPPAV